METTNLEERASQLMPEERQVLDAKEPMRSADEILLHLYMYKDLRILVHYQGSFYVWSHGCYIQEEYDVIRAKIYCFLENSTTRNVNGDVVPFKPNRNKVADVLDAVKAKTILPGRTIPPCWLDNGEHYNPSELVPCKNGVLHLPTDTLLPLTPLLFTFNAINYDYKSTAPEPKEWLKFLGQVLAYSGAS